MRLRQGVCAIILGSHQKILVGERSDQPGQWQLPQGGIDRRETPEQALHREVEEEVGLRDLAVLNQTSDFIPTYWPAGVSRPKYHGQEHIYFLLRAPDVEPTDLLATPEFARFKWNSAAEVYSQVIEWKKPAYERAFQELQLKLK